MSELDESNGSSDGSRLRPSLGMLRDLTDDHVLDQLLGAEAMTRAEIAARTGISKPTISDSVRRLTSAGLISASGRQSGKRGPAATFYSLHERAGNALVLSAGPAGVISELRDLRGALLALDHRPVRQPTTSAALGPIMVDACRAVLANAPGPVLATTVSVANPVDRRTGQLIRLPDSPFLLDELNPAELLTDHLSDQLSGSVVVDNDVNWAALAEQQATGSDDFAYCYLGPGLGLALVLDGRLIRGHRGLAGELAYVLTEGADGRSRPLLECFGDWGLLQADGWAIDTERVAGALRAGTGADAQLAGSIVRAVAGALGSITAVTNPESIVIAQDWGWDGDLVALLAEAVEATTGVPVELRAAAPLDQAPLTGARAAAVRAAQQSLLSR